MSYEKQEMMKLISFIWICWKRKATACTFRISSEEAFRTMIHAYQEIYLSNAQRALGEALDYAVNTCGLNGADFVKMFTVSSVSKHMENGDPNWLSGKSGIEVAEEVFLETIGRNFLLSPRRIRAAPKSIGLAGQPPITNGIPQEGSVKFSKQFPMRILRHCIIHSTKRIFQNLWM